MSNLWRCGVFKHSNKSHTCMHQRTIKHTCVPSKQVRMHNLYLYTALLAQSNSATETSERVQTGILTRRTKESPITTSHCGIDAQTLHDSDLGERAIRWCSTRSSVAKDVPAMSNMQRDASDLTRHILRQIMWSDLIRHILRQIMWSTIAVEPVCNRLIVPAGQGDSVFPIC